MDAFEALIDEGRRLLHTGVALREVDIDMVCLHGYGFAPYRGGPMFWGDLEGAGKIVEALERRGVAVADSLKAKAA